MYTLRKCGSRLQVPLEALYARANLPASAELRRPSSEETLEAETETSEKEACGSGPEARGPKREFHSQPPTGTWRSVWSRPQLRPDGTSALWSRPKTTRLLSKTQKGICISSNAAKPGGGEMKLAGGGGGMQLVAPWLKNCTGRDDLGPRPRRCLPRG